MEHAAERHLPTGTVTFLFTDIEGSTRLLRAVGDDYGRLLDRHRGLLRSAFAEVGGVEVGTEGDSFFVVFPTATGAVAAAAAGQRSLAAEPWPTGAAISVRMGLLSGEVRLVGGDYVGLDVHRAARIAAVAHGGQVLISETTRGLVARALPEGVALRPLGRVRLKDFGEPEQVTQLVIDGLRADFPALRGAEAPNNLPALLSSFIGREHDMAGLERLLAEHRLVTLSGPGGSGKTRLAIELGRRLLPAFDDGVFFVRLDAATTKPLVVSAVAQTLGLRESLDRQPEASVVERLQASALLLILDNFEQALEAAPFVAQLLEAAPQVRVIATSRAPLRIYGEQEYPVPALDVPAGTEAATEVVAAAPAVALFVERARAVAPAFALTAENAATVAQITARLDGLPLAIELAAARVRVLPPTQILERLTQRVDLLQGGAASLPPRQRSLRAAIDWSFALLDEPERRLLRRCAVFVGGGDTEAIGDVCDLDGGLGDPLELLSSLVEKSLMRAGDAGRFGMLQTIRDYALERLDESGERSAIATRHADFVRRLLERAEPELQGPQTGPWMERLGREDDNIRAALGWAIDTSEVETAMAIAAAAWRFWQHRGELREGRAWLDRVLALPAPGDTRLLARATLAAAGVAYWQGDRPGMEQLSERALELARSSGEPATIAAAVHNAGFVSGMFAEDRAAARDLFQESLTLYRALGDEAGVASAAGALGYVEYLEGNHEAAFAQLEEARRLNQRLGQRFRLFDTLQALGTLHRVTGDVEKAEARYREAAAILEGATNEPRIGGVLLLLSSTALALGHPARAMRLNAAARRHRERVGGGLPEGLLRMEDVAELARPLLSDQDYAAAVAEGAAMSEEEAVRYALAAEGVGS